MSANQAPEKTAAERKTAWEEIRKELPREKTPAEKKRRLALFKKFDKDGSKSLTLEETYQGCIDILHLERFTPRLKDITKRAFAKASGLGTQIDGVGDESEVEFLEFRMMLCYIYDYFELTVMFDEIDTSGNMMLDKDEFKEAVPRIAEWGVQISDPDATFAEIDDNGSGQVTFDEFAAWAAAKKLDADGDPDNIGAPLPTSVKDNAPEEAKSRSAPPVKSRSAPVPSGLPVIVKKHPGASTEEPIQSRAAVVDNGAAERLAAWEDIRKELPREKTPEDKKRRIELFEKFDKDGSKSLTLEETYQGCIDILHLERFTPRLKDITKRAFAKASGLGTQIDGVGEEDKVEFLEFRLMLCYIYDYFELTVMFDEIDTSGNMMLDKEEFNQAVPRIAEWGVTIEDPDATFAEIDGNGSGQVTFDEFAAWAAAKKLDADGDPDNIGAPLPTSVNNAEEQPKARSLPEDKSAAERKTAWEEIRQELPRKKTPEDKKRRIELFQKFDKDGSKSLTLEETYQGCIDILHLDRFTSRLKDITKRAFAKASGLGTSIDGVGDESEVEFLEFRMMLCYIYDYFELTVMFDEIDTSGNMMLDKDEFKEAVPRIAEWGVQISDPDATFAEIDDNGSGQVTFDEFAAWATAKKLDADGDPDNIGAAAPTSVKKGGSKKK